MRTQPAMMLNILRFEFRHNFFSKGNVIFLLVLLAGTVALTVVAQNAGLPKEVDAQVLSGFASWVAPLTVITIAGSAYALMMVAVQEKSANIVEILASKASPLAIVVGKVATVSAVGLINLTASGVTAIIVFLLGGYPQLAFLILALLPPLWLWVLLAYFTYGGLYVAIGSMVKKMENIGWVGAVLTVLVYGPLAASFFINAAYQDPGSTLLSAAGVLPLLSTYVVPLGLISGHISLLWAAVSFILSLLLCLALLFLSLLLYRAATHSSSPGEAFAVVFKRRKQTRQ